MSNLIKRISNLITVKSILTLMISVVFCILSLRGLISSESFITIFASIIGYYFGTQKVDDTSKGLDDGTGK